MTNLSINGAVRGNSFSGGLNFGEIIDDLGMAVLLAGEARKGDFFVDVNLDLLRMKDDVSGPGGGDVTMSLKSAIAEGTAGYRFARLDLGKIGQSESPSELAFEALAGVRYYYNYIKLNPENAGSTDASLDWLDLVGGARAIWNVTDRVRLAARADLGGFNIGGSQPSFQALAMLEYDVSKSVSLDLGYRYLSIGYEPEGASDTDLRMRMKGMIAGVSFRF